jgi:putative membrane protein
MYMKHRNVWIGIGAFVVACVVLGLLAVVLVASFGHVGYAVHMGPFVRGYRYNVGFPGIGRILIGLLFWGVIIGGAALLIGWLFSRGRQPAKQVQPPAGPVQPPAKLEESALEILRRRYARGEITREEYDMMKETLTRDQPTEGTS